MIFGPGTDRKPHRAGGRLVLPHLKYVRPHSMYITNTALPEELQGRHGAACLDFRHVFDEAAGPQRKKRLYVDLHRGEDLKTQRKLHN